MPYTSHGHWYGTGDPDIGKPVLVAKCGGPAICETCTSEATADPWVPQPVPCLVCGKPLAPVQPEDTQPVDAVMFYGSGAWGSGFDEMAGRLQVNVCDGCLLARRDRVLHVRTETRVRRDVRPWKPEEEDHG